MFLHESGQWIRSALEMTLMVTTTEKSINDIDEGSITVIKTEKHDPQAAGSVITYLRRYSLQAPLQPLQALQPLQPQPPQPQMLQPQTPQEILDALLARHGLGGARGGPSPLQTPRGGPSPLQPPLGTAAAVQLQ